VLVSYEIQITHTVSQHKQLPWLESDDTSYIMLRLMTNIPVRDKQDPHTHTYTHLELKQVPDSDSDWWGLSTKIKQVQHTHTHTHTQTHLPTEMDDRTITDTQTLRLRILAMRLILKPFVQHRLGGVSKTHTKKLKPSEVFGMKCTVPPHCGAADNHYCHQRVGTGLYCSQALTCVSDWWAKLLIS
jgi:hypothetical protein